MSRSKVLRWMLLGAVVVVAACDGDPSVEESTAMPSTATVTPADASTSSAIDRSETSLDLRPHDEVLSVDVVPAAEIIVFVGNTGPDPDAQAVCDAMFLDAESVATFTEVAVEDLEVSVLADASGVRCEYHTDALGDGFDGNGDGRVEVVSAYVGLVTDGGSTTLAEVPARAVVETPDGLSVREAPIDPDFVDDVDPATNVDLYELEIGTRVAVAVSTGVERAADAARVMLELVLDGVVTETTR